MQRWIASSGNSCGASNRSSRTGSSELLATSSSRSVLGSGSRAYLIGFTSDTVRPFPTCVEPESEPIAHVDLTGVVSHGARLYEEHPDSGLFITSARHHERHHDSLRDWARGEALRLALESDAGYSDRYLFVGASALVDGAYEVHPPVLSVPRARWDKKPRLQGHVPSRGVAPRRSHSRLSSTARSPTSRSPTSRMNTSNGCPVAKVPNMWRAYEAPG